MIYTEQLKQAQLAKMKQRYLDLIEEANRKLAQETQQTKDDQKQLYAERMLALRDLPQQLVAAGRSGGMSDEAMRGVELAYRDGLQALERARQTYLDNYNYEVQKQNRLMKLAVEEYLARIASSEAASAGRSSSRSSKSSSKSTVTKLTQTDDKAGTGAQSARSRSRMEELVEPARPAGGGAGWNLMEKL